MGGKRKEKKGKRKKDEVIKKAGLVSLTTLSKLLISNWSKDPNCQAMWVTLTQIFSQHIKKLTEIKRKS